MTRAALPAPFEPKSDFIYDPDFDRELRWDKPVAPLLLSLEDCEREKWQLLLDDEVTGSYSGLRRDVEHDAAAWQAAIERFSADKWSDLIRVDGSVSRSTYWATTCGTGAYQYHRGDPPIQPCRLDGELLAVVKATLAKCGLDIQSAGCCVGVNVNRYLGNDQSCGAHTDDDKMTKLVVGDTLLPVNIVSLSLGSPMRFEILSVNRRKKVAHCELGNGDILTMEGYFQKVYLHRVKKSSAPMSCRYNLTIRFLLEHLCIDR